MPELPDPDTLVEDVTADDHAEDDDPSVVPPEDADS